MNVCHQILSSFLPLERVVARVQSRSCDGSTAVATIESSQWLGIERVPVVKLYEVPHSQYPGVVLMLTFMFTRGDLAGQICRF